jgi:hypothetical protein
MNKRNKFIIILKSLYIVSQEERSLFLEAILSVILSKQVCIYMCPIQSGFRDRTILLYSSKIVGARSSVVG